MALQDGIWAEEFSRVTKSAHEWLPPWLRRFVPQTFIGFAMINLSTFVLDMILLWMTHGVFDMLYPLAVSVSFGIASVIAFTLNKILNFRAKGDTVKQSGKYTVVLVTNYLIWIVGFSSLLEWIGVHYMLSRLIAAACEGIYIYLLARFWVFPRKKSKKIAAAGAKKPFNARSPLVQAAIFMDATKV